jgi:hypothetical protein
MGMGQSLSRLVLDAKNKIIGVDKIKYKSEALTRWLRKAPMRGSDCDREIELLKLYLTIKSPSWRYEKEARILRFEQGILDIPGEFLVQVCFGLQTPQADIDLISTLAQKYCGCIKFCQMVRGKSDFGFTMKER